jgi:hypothetical protein
MWLMDDVDPGSGYVEIMQAALSRRQKWEEVHNKREHPDAEKLVKQLNAAGWAMFPEAAERLTPYGIFPTGNMHDEIINAMATAPRAPLHEHEGGER